MGEVFVLQSKSRNWRPREATEPIPQRVSWETEKEKYVSFFSREKVLSHACSHPPTSMCAAHVSSYLAVHAVSSRL